MIFLWLIGVLFTLGVYLGIDKGNVRWSVHLANILLIAILWPVCLGIALGILGDHIYK